ncbi:MAG TPA: MarR family transcriptional regulator [Pinirhizobacter sp.]|uniref:MarR family winged helix-turn-helix transcriptional regulator n=1 Tax=Pinirhizobacter sp. TaxID=2950432 RepID=UPI002B52EA64|nr:MarR family transcriptional regulator [Pinirhizobacter sp.]HMH66615.1 MarR family transcriptional regulator [Pinirhizobacter sp.]
MGKSNIDIEAASLELLLAHGQLSRRLRTESATHELSWTQLAVMARLATEGPSTIADLARAEMVRPQSMGGTVAFLEELGLVGRQAHPTDGRQYLVNLTEAGIETRTIAASVKRAWLNKAMAALSPGEQEILVKASALIRSLAGA